MKKNLFVITESERERILGMHKRATASQYLSEQETVTTTTTTVAATAQAPAASGTEKPQSQTLVMNDRDYGYKKEGDKYYFKLQPNPASAKAQEYKKAGKFLDWTEAKGAGLEAIKKLDFKPETLTLKDAGLENPLKQPSTVAQVQVTGATTGGGGEPKKIIDPIGDAKATMPKIDTLDPTVAREVIAWSKTPSGQYVLNSPADQREAALDNLDRRRGDQETRRLKKEIRQALGMAADTLAGKIGSAVRGGVQGIRQGFQQQTT